MIKRHQTLVARAIELGLSQDQAEDLAVAACHGEHWATGKFKQLIREYMSDEIWEKDPLFEIPDRYLPSSDDADKAIGNIYAMRSKALHAGARYPATAGFLGGPWVPMAVAQEMSMGQAELPPVAWFERVVQSVLTRYVEKHG